MKKSVALFEMTTAGCGSATYQTVWDRVPSNLDYVRISDWLEIEFTPRNAEDLAAERALEIATKLAHLHAEIAALKGDAT